MDEARGGGMVALLGLGTAVPRAVPQEVSAQLALTLNCTTEGQRAWLSRVFLRSGISARGTVLAAGAASALEAIQAFYPAPGEGPENGPTTAQRMERYRQEAPPLAQAAAEQALGAAGADAAAITHLVTVSCTGFFAPGLDAALIERLGLPRTLRRLHVGFMGCHAAFNALAAARDAVRATPRARVLVCCVELCSLHFAYGWDPGKLVANALFADGAAAVVLGAVDDAGGAPGSWRLRDTASVLLPGCPEAMTWRIGDHGFEMTLTPEVPGLVGTHLRAWCDEWLARQGMTVADIAGWAIHPGGPKVLTAAAEALGLEPAALRHSRAVLAAHGNMSSATVLFILQEMARAGCEGPCVAIGLGPGLVAEGMLLER
jgi:predicted naringenin-chalcone synthase